MSQNAHPARSPDFLSRLHDGELSPAERAHFESHRAHCAECRAGAAQFEAALSLFRSSRPAPAAPDLSARILRKLQASGRRRPFFGATFGIDLRWAGAFAAAVIAAIVGTSVVARNEARNNAANRSAPIPVLLEKKRPEPPAAAPEIPLRAESKPARKQDETRQKNMVQEEAQSGAIRQRESDKARDSMAANARPPVAAKEKRNEAPSEGLAETGRSERSAPSALAMKSAAPAAPPATADRRDAAPAQLAAPERAGGEGSAGASLEATPSAVRLVVRSLDGAAPAPELLAGSAANVPSSLRGRAYILVVNSAGRVRQARAHPSPSKDELSGDFRADDPPSLLALRFAPGDRARRLLLRIE